MHWALLIGAGSIVFLSVATVAILAATQLWLPHSRLSIGYMMELCFQQARGQTEILFFSPSVSSFAPPHSMRCGYIPWLPVIPHWAHRLVF